MGLTAYAPFSARDYETPFDTQYTDIRAVNTGRVARSVKAEFSADAASTITRSTIATGIAGQGGVNLNQSFMDLPAGPATVTP